MNKKQKKVLLISAGTLIILSAVILLAVTLSKHNIKDKPVEEIFGYYATHHHKVDEAISQNYQDYAKNFDSMTSDNSRNTYLPGVYHTEWVTPTSAADDASSEKSEISDTVLSLIDNVTYGDFNGDEQTDALISTIPDGSNQIIYTFVLSNDNGFEVSSDQTQADSSEFYYFIDEEDKQALLKHYNFLDDRVIVQEFYFNNDNDRVMTKTEELKDAEALEQFAQEREAFLAFSKCIRTAKISIEQIVENLSSLLENENRLDQLIEFVAESKNLEANRLTAQEDILTSVQEDFNVQCYELWYDNDTGDKSSFVGVYGISEDGLRIYSYSRDFDTVDFKIDDEKDRASVTFINANGIDQNISFPITYKEMCASFYPVVSYDDDGIRISFYLNEQPASEYIEGRLGSIFISNQAMEHPENYQAELLFSNAEIYVYFYRVTDVQFDEGTAEAYHMAEDKFNNMINEMRR